MNFGEILIIIFAVLSIIAFLDLYLAPEVGKFIKRIKDKDEENSEKINNSFKE